MPAELAGTLTATEDDRLEQAEAAARSYCGWHIAGPRTETLRLAGTGSAVLVLNTLHVTDVASVVIDGVTRSTDEYAWAEVGTLTARYGRWVGTVEVTLTHGYDVPPADVTAVVQAAAQRALDNPGSKPRVQDGPFSDTFSQAGFNQAPPLALLDAEKAILDRYKLPPRP